MNSSIFDSVFMKNIRVVGIDAFGNYANMFLYKGIRHTRFATISSVNNERIRTWFGKFIFNWFRYSCETTEQNLCAGMCCVGSKL